MITPDDNLPQHLGTHPVTSFCSKSQAPSLGQEQERLRQGFACPVNAMSERVFKRAFNPVSQVRLSLLLNPFNQSLMGEFKVRECS